MTRPSTALLTDHYELTMISAARSHPAADRICVFEVFARTLPKGRRYGVVCGTGRLLEAIVDFKFTSDELTLVSEFLDPETVNWLANYRFTGQIYGYREGELYFPGSPILTIKARFCEAVILETLVLSILNHDSAIASAAARMVLAAGDRPIIEMGSRRTHEHAAVASARAAYLAGVAATSNLEAARCYGVPSAGTAAHAFTLLFTNAKGSQETEAFRAQVARMGTGTTLLVDTYDITRGVANAIEVAGPELGAIRIDSGELNILARQVRYQLDSLGANNTKIVVSGDLDEYAIDSLRYEPIDIYGVGTSLVTGSGAPTAGMVYKLVEIDGIPVSKRSIHKESRGGAKCAARIAHPSGTVAEEVLYPAERPAPTVAGHITKSLQVPLFRDGVIVTDGGTLTDARNYLRSALMTLPEEGRSLANGQPAIPTRDAF